jgi:DNA (cytosine-5)-methyltransferase 1
MRVIDLFSGCGGFALGFQETKYLDNNFKIVAAYENWKPAINVYKANFKHPMFDFDLVDTKAAISHIKSFSPDMISGGPPCQDFSHAGLRTEGTRASLTCSFAQIVAGVRPKWFCMENVERAKNSEAFKEAKKTFRGAGYGLTEVVLDASLYGVPQLRKRLFCIGLQDENDGFLVKDLLENQAFKRMTVRDYLGDELGIGAYYRHPRNYNRRAIFSIDEPAPTVRGVNRPVPKGYKGHHNDPIAITDALRPLSTLERARIQTFPKTFSWAGTKTDLEQMIGNAVPVKLAEFVGQQILHYEAKVNNLSFAERTESLRHYEQLDIPNILEDALCHS